MRQLTLIEIFGKNSYQDSTNLVINKADLLKLVPTTTNTAETLLTAILLTLHKNFEGNIEDQQANAITDNLGNNITFNNSSLYELMNVFYWKRQFIKASNQAKILDVFIIEKYEVQ